MYRIEVQYRPNEEPHWWASIFEGEMYRAARIGTTHEEALSEARTWIARENCPTDHSPRTYYADENGELVEVAAVPQEKP